VGEVQAFFDALRSSLEAKVANSRVVIGLASTRVQ
jgi:hypothetical protein